MKKYAGIKVLAEKLIEKNKAKGINLSKKDAEEQIKLNVKVMKEVLSEDNEYEGIQFVDFLTLEIVTRSARIGRNPRTKEPINIPEKNSIKANVGKKFEEELNK